MKTKYQTYRHLASVLLAVVLLGPALAQDAPAPVDTATMLEQALIPARDRVELAQEIFGVGEIPPPPASTPLRRVGDRMTFRVTNSTENRAFDVPAVLGAVGDHIYLWVEEGAEVSTEDLRELAFAFDQRVYPNTRALWGSEATPGIDGDPRVYGLFAHGLGTGTAAYFISEHSYPVEAVNTSNEHEIFFFNLDALGNGFDLQSVESITAHEFQHMIRFNLQPNEDYWLNEGFSEFTQLHLYDIPIWEIVSFLSNPQTQLNTWAEEPGLRSQNYGAALLFVTYFYDRFGMDALRALSADSSARGLDAVDNVLRDLGEGDVNTFFADWVVSNFLFDPALTDGLYGYQSIPPGYVSAEPLETVTEYPLLREGIANQYGTDYYVLTNLNGVETLTVEVEAPSTVALVPATAFSGVRMWYSNRADVSSTTLTRTFDLTDVDNATLNFRLWYHIEALWDYGYVMASDDGGETWTPLSGTYTTTENPHNTAYGPGYTGVSGSANTGEWVNETISLDAYAGDEVSIRFQVITDDAITQPGMLIDDVRIPEINYASDFEANDGAWQAEGWVWIDNVLPQQAWVQAIQQAGDSATVTRWMYPTENVWTLALEPGVDQVTLALSPFAPVTTVPMPYSLRVTAE